MGSLKGSVKKVVGLGLNLYFGFIRFFTFFGVVVVGHVGSL